MNVYIKPDTMAGRQQKFYTAEVKTRKGPKRPYQAMKGKAKVRQDNCFKICDVYNDAIVPKDTLKAALEPLMATTDAAKSIKAHFFVEWAIKTGIIEIVK